ncbi:hypothetical protein PSHT_00777, partial [Puccinia striiformis]
KPTCKLGFATYSVSLWCFIGRGLGSLRDLDGPWLDDTSLSKTSDGLKRPRELVIDDHRAPPEADGQQISQPTLHLFPFQQAKDGSHWYYCRWRPTSFEAHRADEYIRRFPAVPGDPFIQRKQSPEPFQTSQPTLDLFPLDIPGKETRVSDHMGDSEAEDLHHPKGLKLIDSPGDYRNKRPSPPFLTMNSPPQQIRQPTLNLFPFDIPEKEKGAQDHIVYDEDEDLNRSKRLKLIDTQGEHRWVAQDPLTRRKQLSTPLSHQTWKKANPNEPPALPPHRTTFLGSTSHQPAPHDDSHLEANLAQLLPSGGGTLSAGRKRKERPSASPAVSPVRDLQISPWPHFPGIEEIRRHYPCQTLDWSPTEINPDLALVALSMVAEFRQATPNNSFRILHDHLDSHTVFLPFIYQLMVRPLTKNHWDQIKSVWRVFWDKLIEITPKPLRSLPPDQNLKHFLWISDFILTATIPRIFEKMDVELTSGSRKKRECLVTSNEARILKFLSDGRIPMKLSSFQRRTVYVIAMKAFQECRGNEQALDGGLNEGRHALVLHRLQSTAQLITSKYSDILGTLRPTLRFAIPSFLNLCKQLNVEEKTIDIGSALQGFGFLDPLLYQIVEILRRTTKTYARRYDSATSSPEQIEEENDLKVMLIQLLDHAAPVSLWTADKNENPASSFLPQKIHDLLSRELQTKPYQLISNIYSD